jgi:AcrR family transcriptional regulator
LLSAAKSLLCARDLNEITIPAVSELAGIPVSSVYHFFPDMRELYKALARDITDEMTEIAPAISHAATWQECLRGFMTASSSFFNANPAARQLMLGPTTPPDIKNAACHDDYRFGVALHRQLAAAFHLPYLKDPDGICFRAILIAEALFCFSVAEHGCITAFMLDEAILAATSYLGIYLPQKLEPRMTAAVDADPTVSEAGILRS